MIQLYTKAAGLLSVSFGDRYDALVVHILPRKVHRSWGRHEWWYDGPIHEFGLGPFLLFVWMDS